MKISTVCTCQDTENECETETELCGIHDTQQCNHAEETEQWLSEDFHRQKCEVRARRDAKLCCKILTALGRRELKTWNDVPLELPVYNCQDIGFKCEPEKKQSDATQWIHAKTVGVRLDSSCEDDAEGAEHRGCCIRIAHCDSKSHRQEMG